MFLFILFFYSEQTFFDRDVGNSINDITERDARLKLTFEANKNRFGHVQGHWTNGSCERNKAWACGEGDAQGEAGVGVTARADGIRQ